MQSNSWQPLGLLPCFPPPLFNPPLFQYLLPSVLSTEPMSSVSIILLGLSFPDFISRSYLLPLASLLRCPWLAQLQLLVYPPESSFLLLSLSGLY